jgi:hypothetical protein
MDTKAGVKRPDKGRSERSVHHLDTGPHIVRPFYFGHLPVYPCQNPDTELTWFCPAVQGEDYERKKEEECKGDSWHF